MPARVAEELNVVEQVGVRFVAGAVYFAGCWFGLSEERKLFVTGQSRMLPARLIEQVKPMFARSL